MASRKRRVQLITIFAILALLLAACVRPSPGADTGSETPQGETADPNVGGGVGEQDVTPAVVAPESGDSGSADTGDTTTGETTTGETPRPEGGNDTVDAYPAEEGTAADGTTEDTAAPDATTDGDTAGEDATAGEDTMSGEDATAEGDAAAPDDGAAADAGAPEGGTDDQAGGGTPEDAAAGDAASDAAAGAGTGGPADTSAPGPATQSGYIAHVVQPGENLFRIGLRYGYSWVVLAQINGIPNPDRIVVGQTILIPDPNAGAPAQPSQPAETGQPTQLPSGVEHTVLAGETLYSIALQYGVPYADVAAANGLTAPFVVYPGQVLIIPGG